MANDLAILAMTWPLRAWVCATNLLIMCGLLTMKIKRTLLLLLLLLFMIIISNLCNLYATVKF